MFSKFYIVSKYTFKELLKSRILYITCAIGLVMMLMTYVATEFTYGVPEKVALDVGLGLLSFSTLGISLFMGATLLPNEIDSRTVYMIISRPVPRWVFITGKLAGLICILVLNIFILSVLTLFASSLLGGEINSLIIIAILFNILESILLLLIVVFFSLFTNNILAAIISLVILLSGHAIKETQDATFVQFREYMNKILEFYHLVLPAFYKLNLKDFVIYEQGLDTMYLVNSLLYGFSYSAFVFLL
ncbi:MAG: ABC transporter permease, partial [Bacteriovoracia bacterium]